MAALDTAEKSGQVARLKRRRWRVALLACSAVALLAGRADAQSPGDDAIGQQAVASDDLADLALEDLLDMKVYAASKSLQDVSRAPASVTIVTADEIRQQGYRTLADILRSVRGFFVTYDRDYSYVGVRGFQRPGDYNGRVLLLLNGHRLNDTIYEQALLGTESPIDVELFERVEVIRGPSSSLYGTSAFFAVVNLITRSGRAVNGAEVQAQAGSQQTARGRVTAGGRTANGLEGLLSLSAYGSDGNASLYFPEFDGPGSGGGLVLDGDRDRWTSVFARASANGIDLQVGLGSRRKTIPTAPFDTVFGDTRTATDDTRAFAHAHYARRLGARTTLELRGAYDRYDYLGRLAYDTGLMTDVGHGAWVTSEASIVEQFDRHGLTAGIEYRANVRQDQSADDETGVLLDDRRSSHISGVYVNDEMRLGARVLLNAGLRWDQYYGRFGGTVNPRLALIATPAGGSTLKVLYGRAFRAPNPYELYYGQDERSARLQPERISTYEAEWEQRLQPRLQFTAAAFRSRVGDLIVQQAGSDETIDGLYFNNGDNVTATGVEFELQGELPGRVQGRVAQTFQQLEHDSTGARPTNSPSALTTIMVQAPIPRTETVVGFNGFVIGNRLTVLDGLVPRAFVSNLTFSRRVGSRGLGVSATFYNVFGTSWGDPGSNEHRQEVLPQDGRTGIARLSWRF